jgi:hypothetical protein
MCRCKIVAHCEDRYTRIQLPSDRKTILSDLFRGWIGGFAVANAFRNLFLNPTTCGTKAKRSTVRGRLSEASPWTALIIPTAATTASKLRSIFSRHARPGETVSDVAFLSHLKEKKTQSFIQFVFVQQSIIKRRLIQIPLNISKPKL